MRGVESCSQVKGGSFALGVGVDEVGGGGRGAGLMLGCCCLGFRELYVDCFLYHYQPLSVAGLHFLVLRRQRNEAKKTPSNNQRVSVPSVQFLCLWHVSSTVLARPTNV